MRSPSANVQLIAVGVPGPLPRLLDYRSVERPPLGARVLVPLGARKVVGVVAAYVEQSEHHDKLRDVLQVLDERPLIPPEVLTLLLWAADYYHHAPGEVLLHGLPLHLRRPLPAKRTRAKRWRALPGADTKLARAPLQLAAWQQLGQWPDGVGEEDLAVLGLNRAVLATLVEKKLVRQEWQKNPPQFSTQPTPVLTLEQQQAVAAVSKVAGRFAPLLLHGVTGSGKTEVYLRAIAEVIRRGQQALVLVPEIALTPQTLSRFVSRFPRSVVSHSNLTDPQRAQVHLRCLDGDVDVLIGTRSAVFAPMPRIGLIVVDEEHDSSFKQQDGFRYSARDLAVKRANELQVPVLLGSATPSFETLNNAQRGRYRTLRLTERPNGALLPKLSVVDMRGTSMDEGLSEQVWRAMRAQLAQGNQTLIFINRRGYAPTLACGHCGWMAECKRCDARLTTHRQPPMLLCHHCDARAPVPPRCPDCARDLEHRGRGTQRLEESLEAAFSDIAVVRIDRDVARSNRRLEESFALIRRGEPAVLVGTQILAKGHDFPRVTLSVIVNADGGLFSSDYRAPERTAQLIVQVAGRAGRADRAGEVWLQTHHPDHPVIAALLHGGYERFASLGLAERAAAGWPPFVALALLRAEGPRADAPQQLLADLRAHGVPSGSVQLLGPAPALMEKRAGRFRYQLALISKRRSDLHAAVRALLPIATAHPLYRRVRFSVDMDPLDLS